MDTVKAALAGSRDRTRKLREELAAAKEQLQTAQADNDSGSTTRSRSSDHHKKIEWLDAPILTDGVNPTFKAWALEGRLEDRPQLPGSLRLDRLCMLPG